MEALFLKFFNQSVAAGWLILAVMLLRLLLRKAPKTFPCFLWGLVGVRLVCPLSIQSALSLIPSGETVPPESITDPAPAIDSGFYVVDRVVNTVLSPTFYPQPENSVTPLQILTFVAAAAWIVGVAAMLLYAIISYLRLRYRVREAAWVRENIWECDRVNTPFILGAFRPRILLPSSLSEADANYVLAHERAHLKRRDHWWKLLGFLLLAVHWFNPLVWLAYALLCRDIELACDERVVRKMDTEQIKAYSVALLDCSAPRRALSACPLAFGEGRVKGRIKAALNYKKPAFWVVLVAVAACIAAAVCFLTDPPGRYTAISPELDHFISQTVIEQNPPRQPGHVAFESHEVLLAETVGKSTTVYAWVTEMTYSCEDGVLQEAGGSSTCTAITVEKTEEGYALKEYWVPRDGAYNVPDTKRKFPRRIWAEAMNSQRYAPRSSYDCEQQALVYFGLADEGGEEENVNPTFCARVLSVPKSGGPILVEPFADERESGEISVNTNVISTHPVPDLKEGDEIQVVYNGEMMETYPAQINKVFAIYKLTDLAGQEPEGVACTYLRCDSTVDPLPPTVTLYPDSHTFSFRHSVFSSNIPRGVYKMYEDKLVLIANEDHICHYVFRRDGQYFLFDAQNSCQLPRYRYEEGRNPESPVYDGAVFKIVKE